MNKITKALIAGKPEIQRLVAHSPNWQIAFDRVDALFQRMSNPSDQTWSDKNFSTFKEVYFLQRENDKGMSNIVSRTISGMPEKLKETAKIIFLQIAEVCCFFHASHKVNFESNELPTAFKGIKMVPGKSKGIFTYAEPTPSLYKKTSLTFDYWVPKFIEWTTEIRSRNLQDWKGEVILDHESCTDFMRVCLLFLSDTKKHPPIAKAEDREAVLNLLGEDFIWIKKSAKREDIPGNNKKIAAGLNQASKDAGIPIPLAAWNQVLNSEIIKPLLKS